MSDEDEDIEIPSTPSYTKRSVKEGKKMMETHPKPPKTPPQKKHSTMLVYSLQKNTRLEVILTQVNMIDYPVIIYFWDISSKSFIGLLDVVIERDRYEKRGEIVKNLQRLVVRGPGGACYGVGMRPDVKLEVT